MCWQPLDHCVIRLSGPGGLRCDARWWGRCWPAAKPTGPTTIIGNDAGPTPLGTSWRHEEQVSPLAGQHGERRSSSRSWLILCVGNPHGHRWTVRHKVAQLTAGGRAKHLEQRRVRQQHDVAHNSSSRPLDQTVTTTRSSSAESGRKVFSSSTTSADTERIEGVRSEIKSLAAQRSLTLPVSISCGFDSFPCAMTDLLKRRNFGQQLVELE
jgi:hypothetical protein